MKTDLVLLELERVKDRLALAAGGNTRVFLDQMEVWFSAHPHPGPMVGSLEELQARLVALQASQAVLPPPDPYRVRDPVLAEVAQTRAAQATWPGAQTQHGSPQHLEAPGSEAGRACVLREEPPPQP